MGERTSARTRARPNRGRPQARAAGRARSAPTQARLIALRVLDRVDRTRAYADLTLHSALSRSTLHGVDRALATELVYGTLRWRGRLDFLLGALLDRDPGTLEPSVRNALRLGAYQIVFSDRIPDSAAVDESVRGIRALGSERATGLVNAVLRRLTRDHDHIELPTLEKDPVGHLTHTLSYPAWMAERWIALFGDQEAAALAREMNVVPPRTLRTNPHAVDRQTLLADLRQRFPDATPSGVAPLGIRLGARGNPGQDPAFLDGRCTVQDEASQLIVELLDPQAGERILDACAAPGTKTTAIAERVGPSGSVTALDRHPRRLELVGRDARRLGLGNIACREHDATRPLGDPVASDRFDRVLVDAPCTGLGSIRRNPDARWRVTDSDPARLARLQKAILENSAAALKPGGCVVYSTCTFLPEENEAVIEAFLAGAHDFRRVEQAALPATVRPFTDAGGTFHTWPHRHDTDGFFAVRLERNA